MFIYGITINKVRYYRKICKRNDTTEPGRLHDRDAMHGVSKDLRISMVGMFLKELGAVKP